MAADHLGDLTNCPLPQPAARLERQRLRAEAELKNDELSVLFQLRQKRFINVGGIDIALRWSRLVATAQCLLHFRISDSTEVDVGRHVRGGREHHAVRDRSNVMFYGGMYVVEPADNTLRGRS